MSDRVEEAIEARERRRPLPSPRRLEGGHDGGTEGPREARELRDEAGPSVQAEGEPEALEAELEPDPQAEGEQVGTWQD